MTTVRLPGSRAVHIAMALDAVLAVVIICLATGQTVILAIGGQVVMLAAGGYAAGLLNTAAGSGGLVSMMAAMAAGVAPHAAVVASQAATPASFIPARHRLLAGTASPLSIAAMVVATAAGSVVLAFMPPGVFASVAPVVIVIATVLLMVQPYAPGLLEWVRQRRLSRRSRRLRRARDLPVIITGRERPTRHLSAVHMPAMLAGCGLYAGLIGAGVGTLTVMLLAYVMRGPMADAAAVRNRVCLFAATTAGGTVVAMTVLAGNPVPWVAAATMAPAMYFGGRHGVKLVNRLRPYDFWLRILIAISSLGMVAWLVTAA